jgi:hypothetical protein
MTPIEMQDPLQPGSLLAGRYQVERVLRANRTERRYLAKDLQDGMRTLTLQELLAPPFPTNEARGEAEAWLEQRIAHLRQLAHPGICVVRGVHVPLALARPLDVAYEHVPGMTLAEEYEEADGELSWRQILDWTSASATRWSTYIRRRLRGYSARCTRGTWCWMPRAGVRS